MTAERIDDELLGQYLDGELSPEDAARVRAAIDASPELAERAERERRLGDAVRTSAPELDARLGTQRDSDDLFLRIESAIAAPEGASTKPATSGKVVPFRPARARAFALGSGLLAAAAALFIVLRPVPQPRDESAHVVPSGPRGSEIVNVDFGSNTGTTFSVEGTNGESLAVVWISDSELALK